MRYARNTDPETSRTAGEGARKRALPQRDILLLAYLEANRPNQYAGDGWAGGLTDEEAGIRTGLIEKPGCCYWKRCSELRQLGLIEPVRIYDDWNIPAYNGEAQYLTRTSRAGERQQVCALTEKGCARAEQLLGYGHQRILPPVRRLEAKVEVSYLRWLENVVASARLVAQFDGTDRDSLDALQRTLWEGSDRS